MALEEVGRVGVRAVPDTKRFRPDLLKALERIERQVELKVRAVVDESGIGRTVERVAKKADESAKRNPVKIPTEISPLDAAWRGRLQNEVRKATRNLEAIIPADVDADGLREELTDRIREIQRQMSVEIPVDPTEAGEFRRKVERLVSGLDGTRAEIQAGIDEERFNEQLRELHEKVESEQVDLPVGADTFLASRQISFAARPRIVTFHARVSEASLASVGTALAALSGARLLGNTLEDVGRSLSNFDKNLPRIAAVTTGLTLLGAAAFSSFGSVFSLASGLAAIGGTAVVLPGILAGFGVGLGVTIAVMQDAATVLADLGPAFSRLQDSISTEFWDEAAKPIRNLVNTLLPQLHRSLDDVSTSIGRFAAEWANQLRSHLTTTVLAEMMDNLRKSIDIAKDALDPLVEAFTTLGFIGSRYLPRLAGWFVEISEGFNEFIQIADSNGDLERWAERGIQNLKDLGRIIGETTGIFYGFGTAAEEAGLLSLSSLADGLGRVREAVNDPVFQGALETVFRGAAAGMGAMAEAFGPIHDAFVELSPLLAEVLEISGQIAGALFGGIAEALENPVLQQGVRDFFEGIQEAVDILTPHLDTIASAFGSFLSFAGEFAKNVAPVLATAVEKLGPPFERILDALEPLLPVLADLLATIIEELTPAIIVFAEETLPAIVEAVETMVPIVRDNFGEVAGIIEGTLLGISRLIRVVTAIMQGDWEAAMAAIEEDADISMQGTNAIINNGMHLFLATLITGGARAVLQTASWPTRIAVSLATLGATMYNNSIRGAAQFTSGLVRGFLSAQREVGSWPARIAGRLAGLGITMYTNSIMGAARFTAGLGSGFFGAIREVGSWPARLVGSMAGIGARLFSSGVLAIQGFISGLRSMFPAVMSTLGGLTALLPDWKGPRSLDKVILRENGELVMGGFIDGLESKYGAVEKSLGSLTGDLSRAAYVPTMDPAPAAAGAGRGGLTINGNVGYDPMEVVRLQELADRRLRITEGVFA